MKGHPVLFLLCLLLCALLQTCIAVEHGWKPDELPSPQRDSKKVCGRNGITSAVCTPDGLLSGSDADNLDGLINFIAEGTNGYEAAPCGSHFEGYQIAVAIIARMSPWFAVMDSKAEKAERFAKALLDSWGVGNAECQNGVVLFVAVDDRRMHIATGRGAKQVLTDAHVDRILAYMRPLMREEQYGRALIAAVQRIGLILSHKTPIDDAEKAWWLPIAFMAFFAPCILAGGCCAIVKASSRRRTYKQCREALQRIDRDSERARNNSYQSTSCPICLEDYDSSAPVTTLIPSALNGTTAADVQGGTETEENARETASLLPQTEDASSTRISDGASAEPDPRLTLPCGHSFHTSCITTWAMGHAANRRQCPVCRHPIDGERTELRSDMGSFNEERRFRIRRVRDIYPEYVSYSLMNRFENNRNAVLAQQADFVRLDPVLMDQARSAGAEGSSFSFGGGSSSGGGGGGSSW